MINSMYIQKLFGRFDYNIKMCSDGVTIITGPNGFGKSTILKIIEAVSRGNIAYFCMLDFDLIKFFFDNNKELVLSKKNSHMHIDEISIPIANIRKTARSEFQRKSPWIRKIGPNMWLDMRTDQEISDEKLQLYNLLTDSDYSVSSKKIQELEKKIDLMKTSCGEVRLISEQRLIRKEINHRNDEEQVIDVISELPKRLKSEISRVSEEYSAVANKLDSSYPKRLFAAKEALKDKSEYQYCLAEANEKFKKLNQYNLVDMSLIDEKNYKPEYSTALKIYFDDFSKKYKVFEKLIARLDLFTKIINDRLTFKEIRISRQNGFEIIDTDRPDSSLVLNQLSSGEKQEIVLFYELIFDTKSDLLLLIDEPEISLHINWQKKFLNDLLNISQNSDIQVIVATHSPQIISNHWDIQIDLGELYGKS